MMPKRTTDKKANVSSEGPAARWILFAILSLLFGTSYLFNRVAVETYSPVFVTAARTAIAAVALLAFTTATSIRLPWRTDILAGMLALGLVGNALPFAFVSYGVSVVPSGIAGLIMATAPLATIALAHAFVPDEKASAWRIAGIFVGLVGIVILMRPEFNTGGNAGVTEQNSAWLGHLSLVAAAICYGANPVIAARMNDCPPLIAGTGATVCAAIVLLPFGLWTWPDSFGPVWDRAILSILALGLLSTAAAAYVYFKLVDIGGPVFLSLINFPIPLIAIIAGVLVLNEPFGWTTAIAMVVILVALGLTEYGREKS